MSYEEKTVSLHREIITRINKPAECYGAMEAFIGLIEQKEVMCAPGGVCCEPKNFKLS